MKCTAPLAAFDERPYGGAIKIVGKSYDSVRKIKPHPHAHKIELPCGQCTACRIKRSREWAVRMTHEAQMTTGGCSFITLTFNKESLERRKRPMSLDVKEFQDFMKRLRERIKKPIRFFHCGEYGELRKRPHYHAIIFGHDFDDREMVRKGNQHELPLYKSAQLESLWPYGFSSVGEAQYESMAYVARYVTKKITGDCSKEHYQYFDMDTGEYLYDRVPEYCTMSRRPGIGQQWFLKYGKTDVIPHDYVVVYNGESQFKAAVPRYYDSLIEKYENLGGPNKLNEIKLKRREKLYESFEDVSQEDYKKRLDVLEEVNRLKMTRLMRKMDEENGIF